MTFSHGVINDYVSAINSGFVQKYKSVASVGPPVAVGPCALHTLHTLLLRHWL